MRVKVRALFGAAVMLATIWSVGCGHYVCKQTFGNSTCTTSGGSLGQGTGQAAAFAYYEGTIGLAADILDTSGNFGVIPNFTAPAETLSGVGGMAIAQKQWLYVAKGIQIFGYSINGTTGAVTSLTGSPFASSNSEGDGLSVDPAGKFLFLSGANDNQVTVFAIDQTSGSLSTVGSFATPSFTGQATTDGLGKYLYVTEGNLGSEVTVFSIGSTGFLTPVTGSPFSISIAELRSEPSGNFLLGITGNGANNGFASDNNVYVFSINQSTGAIAPVTGSPFATTFTPAHLAVHPIGTLVYTFNQTVTGASPMEGFRLDATTGVVTSLTNSPFTAMTGNFGLFDQSGAHLFIHTTDTLSVAGVDSTTGALTSIGSSAPGGSSTTDWAVTDPH